MIRVFLEENNIGIFESYERKHSQDIDVVGVKYKHKEYYFDIYLKNGYIHILRYRPQSEDVTNLNSEKASNVKQIESLLNPWEKLVQKYHNESTGTNTVKFVISDDYWKKAKSPIISLTIQDFKIIQNIQLNFNSNINIFLGKNSCGKTSILQAITLALLPTFNKDKDPDFELLIRKEKEESHFTLVRNNINYRIRINDREKKSSINILEPLAVLNRLEDEQSKLEKLQEPEKAEETRQIIDLLVEKLNALIPEEDFRIKAKNRVYYFFDSQNQYFTTDELSEGYRANVVLLSDILFKIISLEYFRKDTPILEIFEKAKGVILIDEFDRHLHPAWQREYLKNLTAVLPNIQFFLTTHNPMAILDREADEIHVLYKDDDGNLQVTQQEGGTKYAGISLTVLKYFHHTTIGNSLNEAIERYYHLVEYEPDNPELETLKLELRKAYIGIPLFDYRYLTFLKFLAERGFDVEDFEASQTFDFTEQTWDELAEELSENE